MRLPGVFNLNTIIHCCRRGACQFNWLKKYDHEIKKLNFADEITIFLIDITCLSMIQKILKLYEDASKLKDTSKFDISNQDKITESIKKIHISSRVRLSLRDKEIILNQILLSKLWGIGQIYAIPKYIKKKIERICSLL